MEKKDDIFNSEPMAELRRSMENCRHGGPSVDGERYAPWFQEAQLLLGWKAPTDDLAAGAAASDDAIRKTARDAVGGIKDRFGHVLGDVRGARFLGAIAVDAWIGNDLPNCRRFLMKAIILDTAQRVGSRQLYSDLGSANDTGSDIVAGIRKCLSPNEAVIVDSLEYVTRGACRCARLAQAMHDSSEIPSGGTLASDETTLPPSLRPNSKLWSLKKHGAANLKAGNYVNAARLYGKALSLVQKDEDAMMDATSHCGRASSVEGDDVAQLARTSGTDTIRRLSEEKAKLESNLSLIFLKQGKARDALQHADLAASSKPHWEKAHGRRGLALEQLRRYEDASAAFSNAIEIVRGQLEGSAAEYEAMRERVERMMESRKLTPDDAVCSAAASSPGLAMCPLSSFLANEDIEFLVIQWCKPQDVSRLAQTCRYFASSPERRQRIARVSALIGQENLEEIVHAYCNDNLEDSHCAFDHLVTAIITQTDPPVPDANSCLNTPGWLSAFLGDGTIGARDRELIWKTCANLGKGAMHQLLISTGNFGAFKWLLRSDRASPEDKGTVLRIATFQEVDSETMAQEGTQAYTYDFDGELFRLVAEGSSDASGAVGNLAEFACLSLNNLILSHGSSIQENPAAVVSIAEQNRELASMYAMHVPHRWPCEEDLIETQWEYSAREISSYWNTSHSREFSRWKGGMRACFRWLREAEKFGYQYIVLLQLTMMKASLRQPVNVSCLAFGLFLLKKSLEHGGSRNLFKTLDKQERHAVFLAEFYSMVRLYRVAFPKVLQWRDRSLASHNVMF